MPLRIIYLDDEPHLCELFVDNFSSTDVLIQTFTDSRKAIAAINASIPDLVFLDYRIPETTGHEVALQLPPTIPKALITGDLSVKVLDVFVRIFHKPFDFVEMEAFIQGYAERKKLAYWASS